MDLIVSNEHVRAELIPLLEECRALLEQVSALVASRASAHEAAAFEAALTETRALFDDGLLKPIRGA